MRQLTALFIIFLFASCSKDVTITPQSLCEKNNTYFVEVHATVNNLDVIFYQGNQTVKPMQTYRMKINEVKSFVLHWI
jgi:predicted adenine nucleotide alpha hydrolase (AANH) superfamily ATPase